MPADTKSAQKTVKLSSFFALSGSGSVKAARRMLMKLNPEHRAQACTCTSSLSFSLSRSHSHPLSQFFCFLTRSRIFSLGTLQVRSTILFSLITILQFITDLFLSKWMIDKKNNLDRWKDRCRWKVRYIRNNCFNE